jgi:hydroxymethylglutaryl-CoA lyase
MIKIIECPRDAIQGLKQFIPTENKIKYIQKLLTFGFDTIDFGSFVSHKAIPQLKDTEEVLESLDLSNTNTKLLSIVANTYGAEIASKFEKISYLGFPFSISNTFLKNNINSSISKSILTTSKILDICEKNNKELVIYMSMCFGNPYNEKWSIELVEDWVSVLVKLGVKIIVLSDTLGISTKENISSIFNYVIPKYTNVEFGFHLHTDNFKWEERIDAAYNAGCRRFDSVISGFGGCPLSGYDMVGNQKTSNLIEYFDKNKIEHNIKDLSGMKIKAIKFYNNL